MTSDCRQSILQVQSVLSQPMTLFQIQFLNAVGDLLDLIPSFSPAKHTSLKFLKKWDMGHCSALIKVRHTHSCVFWSTQTFSVSPKYDNI